MRKYFYSLFVFLMFTSSFYAQTNPSFNKYEARDMIALCNSFTQIRLFNTDQSIVPKEYDKIYTSGVYGLDNKFQIWQKQKIAVIVYRGSTAMKSSWLENMYSVMIAPHGQIILPGLDTITYRFAQSEKARVHAGWSLGVSFLIRDIIHEIQLLNSKGIYEIVLTGHSQGGALSQLSRAFLENLPTGIISSKTRFRTYAFASPMIGNEVFINEYAQRYEMPGTSFSIFNSEDMVPKMPITVKYSEGKVFSFANLEKALDSTNNIGFKELAFQAFTKTVSKDPIGKYIKLAGNSVHKQIEDKLGPTTMPAYSRDIVFVANRNRIVIGPFEELSTQLSFGEEPDTLSAQTEKYREALASIRGGRMYQHKTYNYYLYFLKKYFVSDYVRIIDEERYRWNRP